MLHFVFFVLFVVNSSCLVLIHCIVQADLEMGVSEPKTGQKQLYADEVFLIQGAVFEVYRAMGAGFLEAVYQECLAIEFAERKLPFVGLKSLSLDYKGRRLRQTHAADFICFDKIIVELKAVRDLAPKHRAQTLNYLRATGLRLGLLVNLGMTPRVQIERFAL